VEVVVAVVAGLVDMEYRHVQLPRDVVVVLQVVVAVAVVVVCHSRRVAAAAGTAAVVYIRDSAVDASRKEVLRIEHRLLLQLDRELVVPMPLLPRLPHRTAVVELVVVAAAAVVVAAVAQTEPAVKRTAAAAELVVEVAVQRRILVLVLMPEPIAELVEEALQFLVAFVAVAVLLVLVIE
jgi:hypothetical protein